MKKKEIEKHQKDCKKRKSNSLAEGIQDKLGELIDNGFDVFESQKKVNRKYEKMISDYQKNNNDNPTGLPKQYNNATDLHQQSYQFNNRTGLRKQYNNNNNIPYNIPYNNIPYNHYSNHYGNQYSNGAPPFNHYTQYNTGPAQHGSYKKRKITNIDDLNEFKFQNISDDDDLINEHDFSFN